MTRAKLYCSAFKMPPGCCTSCHEDHYHGWHDLLDTEFNGQTAYVCCAIANAISAGTAALESAPVTRLARRPARGA